jgi:hypothetical protein
MGINDVVPLDLKVNTPQVGVLAKRFRLFSRKTAEGILEMGRAVNEARQLKPSEFYRFCELIDIKAQSATIKKLAVIGMKYAYLMTHADKLPSNWTTVYAVARLGEDEIQKLIDQGVLNNLTPISDVEAASGKTAKPKSSAAAVITSTTMVVPASPSDWSFQVQLDPQHDTLDAATRQVLKGLLDQLRAMKMQVQVAAPLEELLQT